jgi:hypothetical protein
VKQRIKADRRSNSSDSGGCARCTINSSFRVAYWILAKVKQEKGAAEQQREEARDRLECTVCMTAEHSVLFVPCGNLS